MVRHSLGLLVIDGGAIGRARRGRRARMYCQHYPNERQLHNARDAKCRYASWCNFIVICAYLSCKENYGFIVRRIDDNVCDKF